MISEKFEKKSKKDLEGQMELGEVSRAVAGVQEPVKRPQEGSVEASAKQN